VDGATDDRVTDYHLSVDQNPHYSTALISTVGTKWGPSRDIHDEGGRACLNAPWEGPFLVKVKAEGYARAEKRLARGQSVAVALGPEARLTVHVQDSEGNPLPGALIRIAEPGVMERNTWMSTYDAVADEHGTALITGMEPGAWDLSVTVEKGDMPEPKGEIDLDPGDNDLTVTVDKGVEVQVTVLDRKGSPVPDVKVVLHPQSGFPRGNQDGCITSSLGRCVLTRMASGKNFAWADFPDKTIRKEVLLEEGEPWQEITLQEPDGGDLVGQLSGMEPYLPAEFWVAYVCHGAQLGAAVDEAGRFTLRGVPEPEGEGKRGTLSVHARKPGRRGDWLVVQRPVSMADSHEVLNIELPEPLKVEGSVFHGRGPCSGCQLGWSAPSGAEGNAVTTEEGRYSVLLTAPGDYRVIVSDEEERAFVRQAAIPGSTEVDFQLNGGTIKGVVLLDEEQEPAAGADVLLVDETGKRVASLVVGLAGEFVFDGLSRGLYRLMASQEARAAGLDVQVRDDGEDSVTLVLKQTPRVLLDARDAVSGKPPSWYEAKLYDASGRLVLSKNRRASSGGLISLPVSGGGPFTAVLASGNHGTATVGELHPGDPPRTVLLRPRSELVLQGSNQE
ncbi:MAG: hypothetical protein ACE5ID_11830, partial [Acidobacteriota bacterium]